MPCSEVQYKKFNRCPDTRNYVCTVSEHDDVDAFDMIFTTGDNDYDIRRLVVSRSPREK